MAVGNDSKRDMYIPFISVSTYPDLSSNYEFLDSFDISNSIANDSYEELGRLGYKVKLDQHLTGAGGPGILPGVIELIQTLWDNKSFITIPITVIRFIYSRIRNRKAKLPLQSRRLAKASVCLRAESKTLIVDNGVFLNKESIFNTLLECATYLAPLLNNKYPHINFTFELEIKLNEHKAQQIYALSPKELNYRRLPKLFRDVALNENTCTRISISKKCFSSARIGM